MTDKTFNARDMYPACDCFNDPQFIHDIQPWAFDVIDQVLRATADACDRANICAKGFEWIMVSMVLRLCSDRAIGTRTDFDENDPRPTTPDELQANVDWIKGELDKQMVNARRMWATMTDDEKAGKSVPDFGQSFRASSSTH